ncbi:MAG: DUF1801 domain-containing protein [Phycisphaerae bacterium]
MNDVDTYIANQPANARSRLETLRKTIKKAAPEAQEVISYGMPALRFHGMMVWYAAFKSHYSFFVIPKVLDVFRGELGQYATTKSAIKIPFDKAVPVRLVTRIVKLGVKLNLEKARQPSPSAKKRKTLGLKTTKRNG